MALALFLVACGSDEATSTPTTDAPAAATATTAPAATATPTEAPAMGVFPTAGEGGIPASVAKLTVAVDGWGQDDMVPVETRGASFFQDYINVSLLMRETDHSIVGLLATEWELADEGFSFTIHPKCHLARWNSHYQR